MPVPPPPGVLSQGEKKKAREQEMAGPNMEPSSSFEFNLVGYADSIRDPEKKPLLRWHPKGKFVKISTALPSWSGRASVKATTAPAVLYGKKNFEECQNTAINDLPEESAQAILRAAVISHHMGRTLRGAVKRLSSTVEELEREKKKNPYDINNPEFRRQLLKHTKGTSEATIAALREQGGLNLDFQGIQFADLFPELARMIEEADVQETADVQDGNHGSDEPANVVDLEQASGSVFEPGQSEHMEESPLEESESNASTSSSASSSSSSSCETEGSSQPVVNKVRTKN